MTRSYAFLFLLITCYSGSFVYAETSADAAIKAKAYEQQLKEVIGLVEAGAPGLAVYKMDQLQPQIRSLTQLWLQWEEQRLTIYQQTQNWKGLIERVIAQPDTLPLEYSRQFQTQKADAYLQLGQGQSAREALRSLILTASGDGDEQITRGWLQKWRRLIIHSYIAEGSNEDALIAILRFQQDYDVDKKEILVLRARALLLNKRPAEAAELLVKQAGEPEAGMLFLLAQLRSEGRSPVKVMQAGLRHLRGKWANKTLRSELWAVVAEAAMGTGDRGTVVNAVEHVVADSKVLSSNLFDINADHLWNAYFDYALYEGNQAQLLIGQDKSWFNYALKSAKKYPIRQRALYALLMHRASNEEDRIKAAKLFIKSIHTRKNNSYLIQQLFSQSRLYPSLSDVPEPVRRTMIDIALARQDIPLASQIMATLAEPPKGKTSYMWHLRRARILIMGGKPQQGVKALARFTKDNSKASRTQIDHLLQVVFDLQTVGEHDAAYDLFNDVIESTTDKKLHRELYFWMADSRKAQENYNEAAELYLKSAMLLDGEGWDPWGQTARFHAAKALGKAGLIEDAYYILQRLLKVTVEEDRKAVLRYEVQKLQMVKSGDKEAELETDTAPVVANSVTE